MPAIIKNDVVYAGGSTEWKLAGVVDAMGVDNPVLLPSDFNELLVLCQSDNANSYTFNLLKSMLTTDEQLFSNGFYSSQNYYGAVMLKASTSKVYLTGTYTANGVAPNSVKLTVYYK